MKKYKDTEKPKGKCYDCKEKYGSNRFPDLIIPNDIWDIISPSYHKGAGLLCPNCINARLEEANLNNIKAEFHSGPMCIT